LDCDTDAHAINDRIDLKLATKRQDVLTSSDSYL
jgi:hypothetical protein